MFISNLNQKKKRVWEESLNKILIKTIMQNQVYPIKGILYRLYITVDNELMGIHYLDTQPGSYHEGYVHYRGYITGDTLLEIYYRRYHAKRDKLLIIRTSQRMPLLGIHYWGYWRYITVVGIHFEDTLLTIHYCGHKTWAILAGIFS
jgi:hypothetical protein